MKKIILTLFSGVAVAFFADAQSIERSVIGSAGGVATTGSSIITWTVGETVVNTASAGSVILTQGFQQPEQSTGAVKPMNLLTGISVYPNPSAGVFTVEALKGTLQGEAMVAEVRDAAGKLVFSNTNLRLSGGTSSLDLSNLPGGFYSLNLKTESNLSATYKLTIIK